MKRVATIFTAMLLMSFLFTPFTYAISNFEADRYDVTVNVNEDQSYNIQETIKADFFERGHGMYRYIPFNGKTYNKIDGKEVTTHYKAEIRGMNITRNGKDEPYEKSVESNGDVMNAIYQVGDPDVYVEDEQTYKLSYKYVMFDDKITDYDMFYLNVLPVKKEFKTYDSKIVINMPKEFKKSDVEIFQGEYGNNYNDKIEYKIKGKSIYINTTDILSEKDTISVRIMLPEGYFKGVANDNMRHVILYVICAIALVALIILWLRFGRDPKYVQTVEFGPPEGMTPSDVGYAIDGTVDKKDITSLVMYFANKGYLTIEEVEGKKKKKSEFVLHKLKDLPADSKSYERTFFYGLFDAGDGTSLNLNDLDSDFYTTFESTTMQVEDSFKAHKEKRIFESASATVKIIAGAIAIVALGLGGLLCALVSGDIMDGIVMLCSVVPLLFSYRLAVMAEKKKFIYTHAKKFAVWLASLILLVIGMAMAAVMAIVFGESTIAAIAFVLVALVGYVVVKFMDRRTKYGSEILGKILGFKEFIRSAELEKLKLLVEENPSYFYNILPYAYVLGLSKKWADNFKDIAVDPPYWYNGYYGSGVFSTYLFMSSYDNCMHAVDSNIVIPSSEGGGGSFGGGGGFSGGGVGGGGAGGW